MSDPLNIFAVDNLKTLTGYTINPIIGKRKDIEAAIQKYYYEAQEGTEETTEKFDEIIKDIETEENLELIKEIDADGDKHSIEELTKKRRSYVCAIPLFSKPLLLRPATCLLSYGENGPRTLSR